MTGLTPLAPGVSAWLDPNPAPGHPNAGVVVDEDGITVIDTRCVPSQWDPFADAVEALGLPLEAEERMDSARETPVPPDNRVHDHPEAPSAEDEGGGLPPQ